MFYKNEKVLLLSLVGVLFTSSVNAYDRVGVPYLHTGFQYVNIDDQSARYQSILDNEGVTATILDFDEDRYGWSFGGGIQFHRFVGLDVGYMDLSDGELRIGADNTNFPLAEAALDPVLPMYDKGYFTALTGYIPVTDVFSLYASVGYMRWIGEDDRSDDESILYRIGGKHSFTSAVDIDIYLSETDIDDRSALSIQTGIRYYFWSKQDSNSFVPISQPPQRPQVKPLAPQIDANSVEEVKQDECSSQDVIDCAEVVETQTLHVQFESNSAILNQSSMPDISSLVARLESDPDLLLHIEGHTDSDGAAEYNLKLSQARAESVALFLSEYHQLDEDRMWAQGYGETKPVASNDSAEGKKQNRRVVINLVNRRSLQ
ncbi:MAG TPA: hypothetical protein DHW71_08505 [Gammaproteobacteria bacterium]|nr:hypothetical protein [Gammaproteobacteria bacterium]HCK93013.1 hypothetical protein [Gammaproteobacteria bacterium]|tara:strand:- start:167 stop:1288 length:1122 start_codon:yes stop_codon:yes gene_type:complete